MTRTTELGGKTQQMEHTMVKDMKSVVDRYNRIMNDICREHSTIGQRLSEGTENWNLRDMMVECQYQFSTYFELGHSNCNLKSEDYASWRSESGKLERFIKRYYEESIMIRPSEETSLAPTSASFN